MVDTYFDISLKSFYSRYRGLVRTDFLWVGIFSSEWRVVFRIDGRGINVVYFAALKGLDLPGRLKSSSDG